MQFFIIFSFFVLALTADGAITKKHASKWRWQWQWFELKQWKRWIEMKNDEKLKRFCSYRVKANQSMWSYLYLYPKRSYSSVKNAIDFFDEDAFLDHLKTLFATKEEVDATKEEVESIKTTLGILFYLGYSCTWDNANKKILKTRFTGLYSSV